MSDPSSLLCLDVGGGTQDILFYDPAQPIENALKMVLPSPTVAVGRAIAGATAQGKAVFLAGSLMGGGAMSRAIKQHLAAGLAAYAEPGAAASLHDNPDRVRAMGVIITSKPPALAAHIQTGDIMLGELRGVCTSFGIDMPAQLAVALCDHGFSPDESNRRFRFRIWENFLASGGDLAGLISADPPQSQSRLRAAMAVWPGCLVMDTAAAAAWGALQDPAVAERAAAGLCIVNMGNEHTVAFLIKDRRVWSIYEHHTGLLDATKLAGHMERFIRGEISNDEIFDDNGHGCARIDGAPTSVSGPIVLTGPRRAMAAGLGWQTACPHGDVMLSGCFGLLAAALDRQGTAI